MKTFIYFSLLAFLIVMNHSIFGQTFHYITVGNNYFFPAEKTIQIGDTVRWINGVDGGGVHNVVANDGSFTSGLPAFPWTFIHIFISEGVFPYHCSDHSSAGMTGTIIVQSTTDIKDDNFSFSKFVLDQNYPNPFNPTTKISWRSPISGHQTLKVFDLLGNEVATLIDEYRPAGDYDVEFNGNNISNGVYYYQLKIGAFIETKKLILLK